MNRGTFPRPRDSIEHYLVQIDRHSLLTADEEQRLARAYLATGHGDHAHRLITANLRFVVKVAFEYRSYGLRMPDLIQEGNIGLIRAVQKYDPDKGVRLVSYAVWWIRACIQDFILRSFSIVKLGTTRTQRNLFFSIARTKREIERGGGGRGSASDGDDLQRIAHRLGVKPAEVEEIWSRVGARDLSLEAAAGDEDDEFAHRDQLADARAVNEDDISAAEEQRLLKAGIAAAVAQLDRRERYIIEHGVMQDPPMTRSQLSEHLGVSRQRTRQLEVRAKRKLSEKLHALAVEVDWPTDGRPVDLDDRKVA